MGSEGKDLHDYLVHQFCAIESRKIKCVLQAHNWKPLLFSFITLMCYISDIQPDFKA